MDLNCTECLTRYRTRHFFNPLTPNDHYSGRTAPLSSKRCILYIYSTNTGTDYFKHDIYFPFITLQNAVCFIILTYLVPVLFTAYIQVVLKFEKIIPAPKVNNFTTNEDIATQFEADYRHIPLHSSHNERTPVQIALQ